jgi:hypothetical protein
MCDRATSPILSMQQYYLHSNYAPPNSFYAACSDVSWVWVSWFFPQPQPFSSPLFDRIPNFSLTPQLPSIPFLRLSHLDLKIEGLPTHVFLHIASVNSNLSQSYHLRLRHEYLLGAWEFCQNYFIPLRILQDLNYRFHRFLVDP